MRETSCVDLRGEYYRVLGVPEDASMQEIRRAYRRLARQYHPDTSDQAGAADRFNTVSEAYEVLHDADKRARYDHHHSPRADPGTPGTGQRHRPRPPSGRAAQAFERLIFADGLPRRRTWAGVLPEWGLEGILELSPEEAALAASTALTLTDVRGFTLELPVGICHGQRIRVPGGAARRRPGEPPGDLLLTCESASLRESGEMQT